MEFLKALFDEGALTYEQLETKLKDNKDIKLANLASGQYVDKQKLLDKEVELTTANETIAGLQDTVKQFDGVDLDGLKQSVQNWETKYNDDVSKLKLDAALDLALIQNKAKNPKIIKAALNMENIKLDGDKILGLDEQLSTLKENEGYLFDAESDPNQNANASSSSFRANSGGGHGNNSNLDYNAMSDEEYYQTVMKK